MSAKLARKPEVSVAQYLTFQLDACPKTQREIAAEIGYERSNLITMFKQGLTRVPLGVAPKLAKAIGIDPIFFLRLCMNEYMPEVLEAIESTVGTLPTQNESKVVSILRDVVGSSDPAVVTKPQEEILRKAFKAAFL